MAFDPHVEIRMPVTARLSRAFYDRLGEDIAGELVAWFNDVDATSREACGHGHPALHMGVECHDKRMSD